MLLFNIRAPPTTNPATMPPIIIEKKILQVGIRE